jgi:dTDP-4-dehydrorhamnose 3,5-epimerase
VPFVCLSEAMWIEYVGGGTSFEHDAAALLIADNWYQVWIPPGICPWLLHGRGRYLRRYKTTDFYTPAHDRGIAWHDPLLM